MSLSSPFIKRPIATTLLTAAVALAGIAPSRSAGLAAAAGRLSDDLGLGLAAGREPGDHGLVGRDAARARVRADRRGHRDDGAEHARQTSITLQFDLSRNIDAAARDVESAINAARSYLPRTCRTIRPTGR
jgi:multidrug efflux pump